MTTTLTTPAEATSTPAAPAIAESQPEPITRRVRADLAVGLTLLAGVIGGRFLWAFSHEGAAALPWL